MDNVGRIEKAELYVIKLPLVSPFSTAYGVVKERESLLLKLTSDGCSGWGECVAFRDPWYNYETIDTSLHIVTKYLIPGLFQIDNMTVDQFPDLFKWIKGHNMSKAMVENALLDLYARKNSVPLYDILGGTKKKIRSGISIGIVDGPDMLLSEIDKAVRKNYHRIKVKIRRGMDLNIFSEIRKIFPKINLSVDANGDFTENDIGILKKFDEFDLMMIEQPFTSDNFLAHAKFQEQIKTPVCLDESIDSINAAVNAVNLKSCRVICIKQGRVGGMVKAKELSEFCIDNNIDIWSGGMLETGIGRSFNLHLQTLDGFGSPGDTSESSRFFIEDIVIEPVTLDRKGFIDIPDGSGTGIEVRTEMIEKFKIFNRTMIK